MMWLRACLLSLLLFCSLAIRAQTDPSGPKSVRLLLLRAVSCGLRLQLSVVHSAYRKAVLFTGNTSGTRLLERRSTKTLEVTVSPKSDAAACLAAVPMQTQCVQAPCLALCGSDAEEHNMKMICRCSSARRARQLLLAGRNWAEARPRPRC